MSFTLAWNGTVDLVTVELADLAAADFVLCAEAFFSDAARPACAGVDFSAT
jgi:hypothetical protein